MRVLQVNAVKTQGSTGRNIVEIADYLNNKGHESFIAVSVGADSQEDYQIGTPFEVKLHGLLSRILGTQAYFSKHSTEALLKYIDEIRPDVIHLNNLHANYINLETLLQHLGTNDIPTVVTLHDCWFYTGKCSHYTVDNCFKWQQGCGGCPRLKKDNPSWFFDRTDKMWQDKKALFESIPRLAVVGVSDWITNEAKHSFLSSAKIMTRVYNWIDLEIFKPVTSVGKFEKYGLKDKFVILGVASDWSDEKGLNKFIELSKMLSEEYQIVLVGNQSSDRKIPSNILTIPRTENMDELVQLYSMANVFLTLSKEESFGKVSAEALACGTPIIAHRSTANPELVGDGCGYIIESNEINEIVNAISKVYKKGKEFYSEDCIAFSKANFNKDDRISDYISIYKDIIEK